MSRAAAVRPPPALLARLVAVRDDEWRAMLWAFGCFFCLLAGYYLLRPLRDEMGVVAGVKQLQWLFTATFVATLVAVPVFGAVSARLARRRLLPAVYHFFALNLLVFHLVFRFVDEPVATARVFFVWMSVFNLFVVSVFWSFMADLFARGQGRRLFGFVAAGGSAGALAGPALTGLLVAPLGTGNLVLLAALLLEVSVFCVARLLAAPPARRDEDMPGDTPAAAETALGGGALAGIRHSLASPFLAGTAVYIVLYTATSTFLYFQQAEIVAGAFEDGVDRTRVFALIDFLVALLTIAVQLAVSGRLLARFGTGTGLALVPLVTLGGFAVVAAAPTVWVLVGLQTLRRAANFAVSKPAREVLFTVVAREDRYKSKNFIDTAVYRGGDAVSGWLYTGLGALGLGTAGIAALCVPIAALWLALGMALGRRADRHRQEEQPA